MEPIQPFKPQPDCCCGQGQKETSPRPASRTSLLRMAVSAAAALLLWFMVYKSLPFVSDWFTYGLLGLSRESHLGSAIAFFMYDSPKVMLLLSLVVYLVGIIRSFFTQERTRKYLAGKRESVGNVMAALLGIVTPFCSCSAIPLFLGFVQAGVPLGVTFSFLIAAPMVNEIALILLYGLLGWRVALIYLVTGLCLAMVAGWIIGRLQLESWMEDWVQNLRASEAVVAEVELSWQDRLDRGWEAVVDIVGKVWLYVLAGIAVGALIHGYVPEAFMAKMMGKQAWWSVPAAVVAGIPMYSNAAGIVPVVEALLGKGAALGTVLAFMMSVIALSLPEMIILRKVLKLKMILVFLAVVGFGIICTGYLFNLIV